MTLLADLKELKEQGPRDPALGICAYIKSTDGPAFLELAEGWPEHSGKLRYPVPNVGFPPTVGHRPSNAITAFLGAHDHEMWGEDHPYGAARLRLLDWCIDELEKQQ